MPEITFKKSYPLRNHQDRTFTIDARVADKAEDGSRLAVQAEITEVGKDPFIYLVEFSDPFIATKANFTDEMFLHTAVAIMEAQLESLLHRSTILRIHRESGLIDTEPMKQKVK